MAKGPERMARSLLAAIALGSCYLSYFAYRAASPNGDYAAWNDLLAGRAAAPEQYRVGFVWLAHWIAVHLHVAMPFALAAMDGASGLLAVLALFSVLTRTSVYRDASVAVQWFGAAAFVLLVQWSMAWLLWIGKPETLAAAMLVALTLWLWQSGRSGIATSLLLLSLTATLATVRADVACLLNAGLFLFAVLSRGQLALRRPLAIATGAVGALYAAAFQVWLIRVRYPHASYGRVKLWQLVPNLIHATRWPPFAIFMLPLAWMAAQVVRRRFRGDAAGLAMLTAAALHFALWLTIGKIDEVRIFLPFALALAPLTVEMAMLSVEPEGHTAKS